MRSMKTMLMVTCVVAIIAAAGPAVACKRDLGREVLAPNDGWASIGEGTTGGSAATADNVYTVTNRQELVAALNDGQYPPPSSTPSSTPKIIYVKGTIDVNVDDDNQPLVCEDYYRDGYTLEDYLEYYDPYGPWGREKPSGPLEDARGESQDAQEERVRIRVGDNTTIVGLGRNARILGAWFDQH